MDKLKLGEALSKIKKEKSRLARLILLRKDNIYTEKGKKPKFDLVKLGKEIEKKILYIRKLKIRILKTNLETKLNGDDISLAEAIIKINDLRSRLSILSNLFEKRSSYSFREKDEIEMVPQLDELKIENEIEKTEIEKTQLDNKIQMTNWTTQLLD